MTLLDQAEHAAGILSLVTIGIIAGSLHLAVLVIVDAIAPQWRRILAVLCGGSPEGRVIEAPADASYHRAQGRHWRRIAIEREATERPQLNAEVRR